MTFLLQASIKGLDIVIYRSPPSLAGFSITDYCIMSKLTQSASNFSLHLLASRISWSFSRVKDAQLSSYRFTLGKLGTDLFPVQVRLHVMCRGELSVAIAWMFNVKVSVKRVKVVKRRYRDSLPHPLPCCLWIVNVHKRKTRLHGKHHKQYAEVRDVITGTEVGKNKTKKM